MKELDRMTFCKVCGFKECHHISRLFLSASSEPLDKLAIIADKVSEVVGSSQLSVRPKLFLHHPSHLHAMLSQPWTLSPGRSKSCLYKLLN
ncbi:hypothetical protein TNCV_142021 [Trichonephila clavipes]|nr:hypothetical protein TNCV_142021 [Trichonephila clavipes]